MFTLQSLSHFTQSNFTSTVKEYWLLFFRGELRDYPLDEFPYSGDYLATWNLVFLTVNCQLESDLPGNSVIYVLNNRGYLPFL